MVSSHSVLLGAHAPWFSSFYMKNQLHSQTDLRTARLNKVKHFSSLQNLSETWLGECELGSSKTGMPDVVLPVLSDCETFLCASSSSNHTWGEIGVSD